MNVSLTSSEIKLNLPQSHKKICASVICFFIWFLCCLTTSSPLQISVNAEKVGSEMLDKGGNVHVSTWSWYLNTEVAKTSETSFVVYGTKSVGTCKSGYFIILTVG